MAASAGHLHSSRNPGLFLMGTQGVEKFRVLTSGNDGFQVIGYPEKNVFVLKRASTRVSLGTNTVGSCGRVQGVQAWEQHSKKMKIKLHLGYFLGKKNTY